MFRRTAVTLALVALSLTFVRHASADNASLKPHLAITAVCGQAAHLYDIRNVGISTTAVMQYQIIARATDGMPALKTWNLVLFPLMSGQSFQVSVPRAAWGLRITIKVTPVAGTTVDAAAPVSYPSFCW